MALSYENMSHTTSQIQEKPKKKTTEHKTIPPEVQGKIANFVLERSRGFATKQNRPCAKATLENNGRVLRILSGHANLLNPDSIRDYLVSATTIKNSTKVQWVKVYKMFAKYYGLAFNEPNFQIEDQLPWVPSQKMMESVLDAASSKPRQWCALQLLYETAMRRGEIPKLELSDFNFEKRTVTVRPEKGSLAREVRLSEKLVAQLKLVFAKNPKKLFPTPGSTHLFLLRIRKTLAERHSDPNYHKIHPHTFRHYRATTEYHGSKDILGVQRMLGHKALNNTMRYTHLVEWPDAESFMVKEAKTTQEALQLGKMGFEKYDTIGDVHLYRKRLSAYR